MIPKRIFHILNKTNDRAWIAGTIGGISGQIIFELGRMSRQAYQTGELLPSHQIAGWAPDLASGLALGLLFAVIVSNSSVTIDSLMMGTVIGFGYGLLTWFIPLPVVASIGLELIGVSSVPAVRFLVVDGLIRHVVYGMVLGAVYALFQDKF